MEARSLVVVTPKAARVTIKGGSSPCPATRKAEHRHVGPEQAMPNPRLNDYQIEAIVAYFETLKAEHKQ